MILIKCLSNERQQIWLAIPFMITHKWQEKSYHIFTKTISEFQPYSLPCQEDINLHSPTPNIKYQIHFIFPYKNLFKKRYQKIYISPTPNIKSTFFPWGLRTKNPLKKGIKTWLSRDPPHHTHKRYERFFFFLSIFPIITLQEKECNTVPKGYFMRATCEKSCNNNSNNPTPFIPYLLATCYPHPSRYLHLHQ